jgi:hypothetical protein
VSKFNEGDKVRVVKGVHAGLSGVVTDPWWQLSQSDWPCVEFLKDDGTYTYADEDDMELTEDPYEYAVMQTRVSNGEDLVKRLVWGTLKEAQDDFGLMNRPSAVPVFTYRIVKRRKAGEIEDAT